MNYQKTILVGFVTRDAQKRTSKKGDITYATFSIAVNDGKEMPPFSLLQRLINSERWQPHMLKKVANCWLKVALRPLITGDSTSSPTGFFQELKQENLLKKPKKLRRKNKYSSTGVLCEPLCGGPAHPRLRNHFLNTHKKKYSPKRSI